jgi:hypothetical protein
VDHQIFGRTSVLETVAKIDLDAADAPDALNACKFGLAFLQGVMRAVALAGGLFEMLPEPLGGDGFGKWFVRGDRGRH